MSWICICKATKNDEKRLIQRSIAFANRWGIPLNDYEYVPWQIRDYFNQIYPAPIEKYYYDRVCARALGHPHARDIAWGYIGYSSRD